MGRHSGALIDCRPVGRGLRGPRLGGGDRRRGRDARDDPRARSRPTSEGPEDDFRVYWKNGLNMKSGDGNFAFKIGGRIQADFLFVDDYDQAMETRPPC